MGKYNVKFSCGHEEQVILYGKYKDRNKKIAYFEKEGLCSECYKKKIKERIKSQKSQLSPDNKNYTIIQLKYGDYKSKYPDCTVVKNSYNQEDKTISIYVPKANYIRFEVATLVDEFLEDADNLLKNTGLSDPQITGKIKERKILYTAIKNRVIGAADEDVIEKLANWYETEKENESYTKLYSLSYHWNNIDSHFWVEYELGKIKKERKKKG